MIICHKSTMILTSLVCATTKLKAVTQNLIISCYNMHFNPFLTKTGLIIIDNARMPWHEISNNVVCVISKSSDQPAHMRSLIRAIAGRFEYSMIVKLLIEHHLQFLSLKGGCRGSSESTLVKMPHCWKSHVVAHF